MLIWLDSSIFDAALPRLKVIRSLDLLFDAVFRGEHYVLADREVLNIAFGINELSFAAKIAIDRTIKSLAQYGGLPGMIRTRVVVKGCEGELYKRKSDSEWEVSLDDIIDGFVHKVVLITEDIVDGEAFKNAALQYAVSKRLISRVNIELDSGGGSSTPDTLENQLVSERRWVLCITDSDREYPGATLCPTARKCEKLVGEVPSVSEHVDIDCREAENVIPISFFDSLIDPTKAVSWDSHKKRIENFDLEWHKYCDLKYGVSLKKLFSLPEGAAKREYWLKYASAFGGGCKSTCISDENCLVDNCECFITHGFGDRLLERVVQEFGLNAVHYFEKISRNDANRDGWYSLGQTVYEWGCAPQPIRC